MLSGDTTLSAASSGDLSILITSVKLSAANTVIPSISAPSIAEEEGSMQALKPSSMAWIIIGRAPGISLRVPSRASSPSMMNCSSRPAMFPSSCPDEQSIPMASGTSKEEPSFLMFAGARLIVILFPGILNPLTESALSILC